MACDGIIIENGKIALIKRGKEPFIGQMAIPGGRLEDNEMVEECLIREMKEETNLIVEPIALIGIYSDPKRDPRGIVALTYLCKRIEGELRAGDDAAEANWFDLKEIPQLASDHGKMVQDTLVILKKQRTIKNRVDRSL